MVDGAEKVGPGSTGYRPLTLAGVNQPDLRVVKSTSPRDQAIATATQRVRALGPEMLGSRKAEGIRRLEQRAEWHVAHRGSVENNLRESEKRAEWNARKANKEVRQIFKRAHNRRRLGQNVATYLQDSFDELFHDHMDNAGLTNAYRNSIREAWEGNAETSGLRETFAERTNLRSRIGRWFSGRRTEVDQIDDIITRYETDIIAERYEAQWQDIDERRGEIRAARTDNVVPLRRRRRRFLSAAAIAAGLLGAVTLGLYSGPAKQKALPAYKPAPVEAPAEPVVRQAYNPHMAHAQVLNDVGDAIVAESLESRLGCRDPGKAPSRELQEMIRRPTSVLKQMAHALKLSAHTRKDKFFITPPNKPPYENRICSL